jgi:hypothetical protein
MEQTHKQSEERILLNEGGRNQQEAKRSSKRDKLHVRERDMVALP